MIETGDVGSFLQVTMFDARRRFGTEAGLLNLKRWMAGKKLSLSEPKMVSRYYIHGPRYDDWDEYRMQMHVYAADILGPKKAKVASAKMQCLAKYAKEPLPPGKWYEYDFCWIAEIRPAACGDRWRSEAQAVEERTGYQDADFHEKLEDRDARYSEGADGRREYVFHGVMGTGQEYLGRAEVTCTYDDRDPCRPSCRAD